MRKLMLVSALALMTTAGTAACASKGYVNTRVGAVDAKVNTATGQIEETQARVKTAEGRISEVDSKAGAAQAAADSAAGAASAADAKAASASSDARTAGEKAEAVAAASRRLVYEVVLSEDQGKYKLGSAMLPDAVKSRIDDLVNQLKADPKGVYFEIEGHTDSTGSTMTNERLGAQRADMVKRYLYEAHQIPLHKINVISFGEKKPVAPNTTRDGRAQNRRIVIRVLA
jgi:outer membrane protein OmpA-like peptidoglycan-associated protein